MATRPKPGQVEERQAPLEADGKKIRGKIPYGTKSGDLGGFVEVISREAFRNTDLDDLVAVVDHQGVPLARYPSTLELEDREDGLHWSFDPPRSREDIREAVDRRDLQGGSWRMVVRRDHWEGDVRHVEDVEILRDVSVVTRPAYRDAVVELRSVENNTNKEQGKMEQEQHEQQDERREEQRLPAGSLRVEERAELPTIHSLADAYAERGFFENRAASLTWDEFRSFTWSAGTALGDLNPLRRDGVGLGYDRRWLYPVLPQTAVSDATTSVQYLRQSGRSLAGTAVIRALDATSTKPETSGTAELQTLQLNQIATVQSGIPRIHQSQPLFQDLVEQDLRLAIGDGLDELVRRGVVTAGTAAAVTGNVVDKVRKARTLVEAQGYSPDTLAIDAAGAEALDLLKTEGSEAMYVFTPGQPAPAPWGLQLRVWKQSGTAVIDSNAFGRLYVSPIELRAFEADGGLSNTQNVRLECNAGFGVERVSAGLRIV